MYGKCIFWTIFNAYTCHIYCSLRLTLITRMEKHLTFVDKWRRSDFPCVAESKAKYIVFKRFQCSRVKKRNELQLVALFIKKKCFFFSTKNQLSKIGSPLYLWCRIFNINCVVECQRQNSLYFTNSKTRAAPLPQKSFNVDICRHFLYWRQQNKRSTITECMI